MGLRDAYGLLTVRFSAALLAAFLLALQPASMLIASATAPITVTPSEHTAINGGPSEAISSADATGYETLTYKIDYESKKLDSTDLDKFDYGWRVSGGANQPLGTVVGEPGNAATEQSDKNHVLPAAANDKNLEFYFISNGDGTENDRIKITNITLSGSAMPTPAYTYDFSVSGDGTFTQSVAKEFSVTTTTDDPTGDSSPMVRAYLNDNGANGNYEYKDGSGNYQPFDPSFGFGPLTGFEYQNGATSDFRATYPTAGNFSADIEFRNVSDNSVVASKNVPFSVAAPSKPNSVTVGVGGDYATLREGVDAVADGGTVTIISDIVSAAEILIDKPVRIVGDGYTLSTTTGFVANDSDNSVIEIANTTGVSISDLLIDGTGGTNINGINTFKATASFDGVTVSNNDKYGLVVNGSEITVTNITTGGNSWGGINVDQSSTSNTSVLTVNGISTHSEASDRADIFVDDTSKDVTVVDTNSQYDSADFGFARAYKLKTSSDTTSPEASAGEDKSAVGLGTILNGSSDDATATYTWTLMSGPGTATFSDNANATTAVAVSAYGTYIFELTARDNAGNSDTDTVRVTFTQAASGSSGGSAPNDPDNRGGGNAVSSSNNSGTFVATTGLVPAPSSNFATAPLSLGTTSTSTVTQSNDEGAVLGESSLSGQRANSDEKGDVLATTDDADKDNVLEFFGIPWYWWLILLTLLAGLWWLLAARRRRREDVQL